MRELGPAGLHSSGQAPGIPGAQRSDPIAVVGMACRFPGARNLDEYWRLLSEGRSAVTEVPATRWAVDELYDADILAAGKMISRWGGFLDEIDQFDPSFFGISPVEAVWMDPQQRLLLELAWEALENGGLVADELSGTSVGVFIGLSANDYSRGAPGLEFIGPYAGTGNALSIGANRLSYLFDFRGPSMVVDTACSSALVAMHLACRSIWSGESEAALVGGANVILSPEITIAFTKAGMMSPTGRCRAFSAGADGYVRAEGAGILVLKPLSAASRDGDHVYARVIGTAVNQDGHSNGLTAPSAAAQEQVIIAACREAGVSPGDIDYVEAHGTGTPIGDPIEAKALGRVLAAGRTAGRPCAIGSVKTNFGHMEAAAGVASVIKVCLSLDHGEIPPSLNFEAPSPLIPFDELPIKVQTVRGPWPPTNGRPPMAGVNSFGFGGANAHVVLTGGQEGREELRGGGRRQPEQARLRLLPISARSPEGVAALAGLYASFLDGLPGEASLTDVCFTASQRRAHLEHRAVVVARERDELLQQLATISSGLSARGAICGYAPSGPPPRLVYVCSGQGPQWWGMGRQLLESTAVFRDSIEECDAALRRYADWSLIDQLRAAEDASVLDETEYCQPALFALQVALATLWRSWGLPPDAVVGHSVGEVAAAHIADVLDLDDAARLIIHRGRLMQGATGKGRMAVVSLPAEEAEELLRGLNGQVAVAAINTTASTVIAGATEALEDLVRCLGEADVATQYLPVNYAFHSPQVYGYEAELKTALAGIRPQPAKVPMFSTVTGQLGDDTAWGPQYWADNVHGPVRFSDVADAMIAEGYRHFVELSPHPVLASALSHALRRRDTEGVVLPSLRRDEEELRVLYETVAALHVAGVSPEWPKLPGQDGRVVQLPTMAWQRSRCWPDAELAERAVKGARGSASAHPLLRRLITGPHLGWEGDLSTQRLPLIAEHRFEGAPITPGSIYIELALAAGYESLGTSALMVGDIEFTNIIPLEGDTQIVIRIELREDLAGQGFEIFTAPAQGARAAGEWALCASGFVRPAGSPPESGDGLRRVEEALERCTEEVGGAEFYEAMAGVGLEYGSSFQGIESLWRGPGEVVARVCAPEGPVSESLAWGDGDEDDPVAEGSPRGPGYVAHPTLLDICAQCGLAIADSWPSPYLPVGAAAVRQYRPLTGMRWSHMRLRSKPEHGALFLEVDGETYDDAGNLLVEVEGGRLQLMQAPRVSSSAPLDGCLYSIEWRSAPRASVRREPAGPSIILADEGGVADRLTAELAALGEECVLVRRGTGWSADGSHHYHVEPCSADGFARLLQTVASDLGPPGSIVDLWGLDIPGPDAGIDASFEAVIAIGTGPLSAVVQAATSNAPAPAPRLWVVTAGVHGEMADGAAAIGQGPLWGFTKTLAYEHPELRPTLVDLCEPYTVAELASELSADLADDQIRLRDGERHVARLASIAGHDRMSATLPAMRRGPFRLDIETPGIIDNLIVREAPRRVPQEGQVEIAVRCAGLNFRDVMKALGIYPMPPGDLGWLGDECSGVVTATGPGVQGIAVGDEVYGIAPACFGSHAITDARFVVPKPATLSFEEAAGTPVVFLTAYYALHHLARLQPDERVLIHAGAGGVGLAAIQIARWLGAEVYTTAGSDEKRDFLRSLGIEHVMDSRSEAFAAEVMRATDGAGVDVVLNSLGGKLLPKGLEALGAYGRFVEIGKRDIYLNSHIGLDPFKKSLSFMSVDMDSLFRERPDVAHDLLRDVAEHVRKEEFQPLPCEAVPFPDAAGAFHKMAHAKHIGKIVIALDVPVEPSSVPVGDVRDDATYLITGGLGGLGSVVAEWLVARGARHLALLGRTGLTPASAPAVAELESAGAQVRVLAADVSIAADVARALREVAATMPLIRGVVHAAGVLDDASVLDLTPARIANVMAPKMIGAWHLHDACKDMPLDFFLLFSSAAGMLGSPWQAGYAAGNAFLDGLAAHRAALGLAATSVAWGPWAEVGMAAGLASSALLDGMGRIAPADGVALIPRVLSLAKPTVGVLPIDWPTWFDAYPMTASMPLFADFTMYRAGSASSELRRVLLQLDPGERLPVLIAHLKDELARVLQVDSHRLLDDRPVNTLGVDSLMGIEFKNRIDRELAITLPMVTLVQGPTISELAALILRLVEESKSEPAGPTPGAAAASLPDGQELDPGQIAEMSEEEVDSMLAGLLRDEPLLDPWEQGD